MDSEELTIYYNETSQPSRAVKTIALIGKIPHREELVNIYTQENKDERITAINKRG